MTNSSATVPGTLYIVATPIGNLQDISLRALDTLKQVDGILAEDTRHSGQLCHALGIEKPLISLHEHNENSKAEQVLTWLLSGKSYALISDAGTPLISDPGFVLVRLLREQRIPVVPVPGCCALITALSASGVPCDTFSFLGFLPAKSKARKDRLKEMTMRSETLVVYESTHRIIDSLQDIAEVYGLDYRLVLAKELTKAYEHFEQGSAEQIIAWLQSESGRSKGEFVLLFPPLSQEKTTDDSQLLKILLEEVPLKQAVKIASRISKTSKNELYQLALGLQ
ncbi:tetrapyrrole (corrin/porphyrin) methylase [Legionella quinlivanii]|uniref:Ribosomal RNA small subunit methyltransferase I n=1 Tax=Legionella quinlivanii TaxID=45073 RepID=A0A0W0Y4W6_9GAMM|nr:16S rRNA (cytidine(1402)-2'-O)-methyltransferase [Legionella quinlivanii]KTD51993.1 tetrapyrrole (corrin/porphyrin) methylase [Legionella quinlivanii]MCW8452256.1 16S rRNA (cytidine(1402)-2'-O)-methyltransferase [Legionella quinlivanii]SEF86908.1 16S rRNA (cytidine1402-2'-O)-methyltransferase [Legionella quinlivanii DSM 21216]STY12512.1 tetrapyrrole (corrin/porphyrin) methylase [Legionella quinlivanii]